MHSSSHAALAQRTSHALMIALAIVMACALLCAPHSVEASVAGSPEYPFHLNLTLISFSLSSHQSTDVLLDSSAANALWAGLQADLASIVGADPSRVYKVSMLAEREMDPLPDIVLFSRASVDAEAQLRAQASSHGKLSRAPLTFARGHGRSAGGISSAYAPGERMSTQSLELIRVSLCFVPAGVAGASAGPDVSGEIYASRLATLLDAWTAGAGGTEVGPASNALASGAYSREIHPLVPHTISPGSDLSLCSDQDPFTYAVECPSRDPRVYWGSRGLLATVLVALFLFAAIFVVTWVFWTRAENRRLIAALREPLRGVEGRFVWLGEHNTKFKQQNLDNWSPTWSPRSVALWTVLLGLTILLPVGITFAKRNQDLVEVSVRYDDLPQCDVDLYSQCTVKVPIEHDMKAPVFFYYGLENFFQNHRSYVMSRSDAQLRNAGNKGRGAGNPSTDCMALSHFDDWGTPAVYPAGFNRTQDALYPCGLMAQSFFNDAFPSATVSSDAIDARVAADPSYAGPRSFELRGRNWDRRDIAWRSDIDGRFSQRALESGETDLMPRGLARPTDSLDSMRTSRIDSEEFMVWMRGSPFSTFFKFSHKVLDRDLRAGEYVLVTVQNNFRVSQFQGKKFIKFATAGEVGTKNAFLGIVYLFVACLYVVSGLLLWFVHRHDLPPMTSDETLQIALESQAARDEADRFDGFSAAPQFKVRSSASASASIATLRGKSMMRISMQQSKVNLADALNR